MRVRSSSCAVLANGRRTDGERPADMRILVDVPQCKTHPHGRRRPRLVDASRVFIKLSSVASIAGCFHRGAAPKKPGRKGPSKALIEATRTLRVILLIPPFCRCSVRGRITLAEWCSAARKLDQVSAKTTI